MTQALKIISGYDPELLTKALLNGFVSSQEEIYNEIETLGWKADEDLKWFIDFSFAFSSRHDKTFPDNLAAVPLLPPTLGGKEDSGSNKWNRAAFAAIDELPDQIFDNVKALSVLGMAAFLLEMAQFGLSEKRYDRFLDSLVLAHEALAQYRLRVKGIEKKKLTAKANALKRHQQTYMLRNEVVEYWKANISPALSNEKAADALLKTFPLSHRKLKQYVAAAKREGTPC